MTIVLGSVERRKTKQKNNRSKSIVYLLRSLFLVYVASNESYSRVYLWHYQTLIKKATMLVTGLKTTDCLTQ